MAVDATSIARTTTKGSAANRYQKRRFYLIDAFAGYKSRLFRASVCAMESGFPLTPLTFDMVCTIFFD